MIQKIGHIEDDRFYPFYPSDWDSLLGSSLEWKTYSFNIRLKFWGGVKVETGERPATPEDCKNVYLAAHI